MVPGTGEENRIQPCAANPFYWQYRGRPVLLLGGTVEDNLFQIPDLEEHLDLLKSVGGNYVRCTMSSRDEGDLWPFARDAESGLYDLSVWNGEYWDRLALLMELTADRDTIVQVELWATWDFYKEVWPRNPFNPANNVNYTAGESGVPERIEHHCFERIQPFFESVPGLEDLPLVRGYQEAFVDKVLSCTLQFGHVLYCMDNETNADPRWGRYWAGYVRDRAARRGCRVETTEMWDNWDPSDGEVPGARVQTIEDHPHLHRSNVGVTLASPDVYTFVDISNHNTQRGGVHYRTALYVRDRIAESGVIRPITCVKMYGGDPETPFSGEAVHGEERFWRNVFAGVSAVRFHRPKTGLGLSRLAQTHIRSMRMLTAEMDLLNCEPHNDLLAERTEDAAYCLARSGAEYAVCFMDGGEVVLDCSEVAGEVSVRWLDVRRSAWGPEQAMGAAGRLPLRAPGGGFRVALVKAL